MVSTKLGDGRLSLLSSVSDYSTYKAASYKAKTDAPSSCPLVVSQKTTSCFCGTLLRLLLRMLLSCAMRSCKPTSRINENVTGRVYKRKDGPG